MMKYGDHGLKTDILLGLTGSAAASVIVWILDMFLEPGIAATAVVAIAGAGAVIALQRRFFAAPLESVHVRTGRP
jgi:uncharacterized membrane protein YeaQ/YmgE (transglycosylase-associated protein family)